jgi:hypothetical protein
MKNDRVDDSAPAGKRPKFGKRAKFLVAAAVIAGVSPLAQQFAPASAATTHDVWIVGSSIPSWAQCVDVGVPSQGDSIQVKPGENKPTVLLIQEGETLLYRVARDAACTDFPNPMAKAVMVPLNLITDHFWLNVS